LRGNWHEFSCRNLTTGYKKENLTNWLNTLGIEDIYFTNANNSLFVISI
jgi:hypothetical protein